MTTVQIHGSLAKEFRSSFRFAINRPKEVFDAISCSHPNFRNRLVELAYQGIHYCLLINGKKIEHEKDLYLSGDNQIIDIVPIVCGSGGSGGFAIGAIVLGLFTFGVGAIAAAGIGAFAAGGALAGVAAYAGTIMAVGLGIASFGLQMAMAPKPDMQRPESSVSGIKESFSFSSKANIAEQGIPVPVGYGRLRVGSAIIQSSIKSYPQAYDKSDSITTQGLGQDKTNDIQ